MWFSPNNFTAPITFRTKETRFQLGSNTVTMTTQSDAAANQSPSVCEVLPMLILRLYQGVKGWKCTSHPSSRSSKAAYDRSLLIFSFFLSFAWFLGHGGDTKDCYLSHWWQGRLKRLQTCNLVESPLKTMYENKL